MEPTPELKALVTQIDDREAEIFVSLKLAGREGDDAFREAHVRALMDNAKELREALLPFERAAELSPAKKAAVRHGQAMRESRRLADERAAQMIGADKPAFVPHLSLWSRAWNLVTFGWRK